MKTKFILIICCILTISINAQTIEPRSLAGEWNFSLDPDDKGEKASWYLSVLPKKIKLPGTTDEAHFGTKTEGSDYGVLTRAYKYIGPAWYQTQITVSKQDANKAHELFLDRVLWESKVWVDGRYCDMQDGLGVPHLHKLGKLSAGKHTITMRINNEMMYNIGDKGHAYGEYTQSIWNGAVGKIELRVLENINLYNIQIRPDIQEKWIKVSYELNCEKKNTLANVTYVITEIATGKEVLRKNEKINIENGTHQLSAKLFPTHEMKLWNEFTPALYRLSINYQWDNRNITNSSDFGFREVSTSKSKILINNKPVFLRGNLDCVHFPLTGYPSCDPKEWERIFKIYKDFGLNHVRFHSWCPPQAAFIAADRLGLYLQVEILWIDWWMTSAPKDRPDMLTKGFPQGLGKNPSADAYTQAEMKRILDTYGNHPSFAMFCIGNELGNSDFDVMQQWVKKHKDEDNRHLYSVSTARKITTVDQYMATHNIPGVGATYGPKAYGTDFDMESNYEKANIPVIAHELGQYPVYPLWSEIDKYTGVLKARNLEECKQSAQKNHLLNMDNKFHYASGALQNILYKAHLENLLRTPSCAGFQMLSMSDYQGQGEALVGWLDCFWDSKGIISPETFKRYCNAVVPLAKFSKFVWKTDELFKANIQISNYGASSFVEDVEWILQSASGRIIETGTLGKINLQQGKLTDAGNISIDLSKITQVGKYHFSITVKNTEFHNGWDLWVYPPVPVMKSDILVATEFSDEVKTTLASGGSVLLLANQLGTEKTTRPLNFTPLFWSTVFFPGQSNSTLGLYVDFAHPALNNFPSDNFSDYQWEKIAQGKSFVLTDFLNLNPIAQPISDFHINEKLGSLFECKAGNGKLIICGHNINSTDNPVAKQLKYSLLKYMQQPNFNPSYEIGIDKLDSMLYTVKPATLQVPKGFEKALLYLKPGANIKENGSYQWFKELDKELTKNKACDYSVVCTDIWKDAKGISWTGSEITIKIKTPKGIIGNLFVKFLDSNNQNREGNIWFEGREFKIEKHPGEEGKWIKIFVMREDTNDGEVILKTRVTNGGNLMINELALLPE